MIQIQIKETSNVPKTATEFSAGYDLIATSDPEIVGEVGQEITRNDNSIIKCYKSIDYIQYRTGVYISPADGYHTLIMPRSSLSKYNLILANSVGLIDQDYTGELLLRFKYQWQPSDFIPQTHRVAISDGGKDFINESTGETLGIINTSKIYKKGDAIGQLVAATTLRMKFRPVTELAVTNRAAGGFGHTTESLKIAGNTDIAREPEIITEKSSILDQYKKHGGMVAPIKTYEEQVRVINKQ